MSQESNTSRGLLASLSPGEIAARIATPPYDALWLRLERRTREVMHAARQGAFRELSTGTLAWHSHTPMVREAALMWRLTGDPEALRYVAECVEALEAAYRDPKSFAKVTGGKSPVNANGEVALAADIARDGLPAHTLDRLRSLMREQLIDAHSGSETYARHGGGSNITYCRMVNAAFCALTWGEDSGHPGWQDVVDHAIAHTRCYLAYGCDGGGFGYEGPGYAHEVFSFLFLFAQLLFQNDRANLFAEEPRLRRAVDASLQLSFPGAQGLVNFNDHGLMMPRSMSWLLYTSRHFADPLHLGLWYAYQGPDHPVRPYGDVMPAALRNGGGGGVAVDQNAAMLQAVLYWDAGAPATPVDQADRPLRIYSAGTETAVMRTSWKSEAVALYLAGAGRSQASLTHGHADGGHFCIHAYGEYLAIDTGRYNVDEDQHSVVLVDGQCHCPSQGWGLNFLPCRHRLFRASDLCTHILADAAHMKDCLWADRHFLFVPLGGEDAYIVVIDHINKDNRSHAFLWQLQGHPDASFRIVGPSAAVLQGSQARLDLHFTEPAESNSLKLSQDEAEWAWPYGRKGVQSHADTGLLVTSFRRPRLLARTEGGNLRLMTVIVPRRREAPPLAVRPLSYPGLLALEIETAAGKDTVIAAPGHGYIDVPGFRAVSPLALLRQPVSGGEREVWNL